MAQLIRCECCDKVVAKTRGDKLYVKCRTSGKEVKVVELMDGKFVITPISSKSKAAV